MTNIEKAKALIGTFHSGDLALAKSLLAPVYTQHNLAFADGRDAFIVKDGSRHEPALRLHCKRKQKHHIYNCKESSHSTISLPLRPFKGKMSSSCSSLTR